MSSNIYWEVRHALRPSTAPSMGRGVVSTTTNPTRTVQTCYPIGYQSSVGAQQQVSDKGDDNGK
jgi:hypothetical protein